MKYANFSNIGGANVDDEKSSINVGDYMQICAIDELYRSMGISCDDIYYINIKDIQNYSGEKLILPINFMISDLTFCKEGKFIFSDDIIPVFIGICIYREGFTFSEYNIDYLRKHSPIGCRDYLTLRLLKSYGIPSYLSGCVTFTLPYREKNQNQNKVYFVDVPEFVREYIPEFIIKKDIVIRHHIVELVKENFFDAFYARNYSLKLKDEYENCAGLVVTSRLHCASPCIAMGIPTILVREYSGYTFEWIKQYVRIFDEMDVNEIDWNNPYYDKRISDVKQTMRDVACYYIKKAWNDNYCCRIEDCFLDYKAIDCSYDNTQKVKGEKLTRILKSIIDKNIKNYCIWGLSEDAEEIYQYMKCYYPKAKLTRVIDTYRDVDFHGLKSEKPNIIEKNNDFFTIVTSINAVNAAKDLFKRVGKDKSEYAYIADAFIDEI